MHQDKFRTKAATKEYIEGWNRIFGKKKQSSKPADSKAPNVTDVRGPLPAFYRDNKSTAPTFHHDGRKRDEPRFSNEKWVPYKKGRRSK